MNDELIYYDINNFLDKITRFMTKDIYISNMMYSCFLKQYDYLCEVIDKLDDNKLCNKVKNVFLNRDRLIRLHNKKYLQIAVKKYDSLFSSIIGERYNTRDKMIILSEEDSTYVVGMDNYISLVLGKLKYLIDYKSYNVDDILILVSSEDDFNSIKSKFLDNGIEGNVFTIRSYSNKFYGDVLVLDDKKRYSFFSNYIINNLFLDKNRFNSFYKVFSKYIYLNKDYKDYETFKDYHNYMYKRRFLTSGLSLNNFNKSEIKKRKTYLRTINNDTLNYKEEVDIANFLYLNSVEYIYDRDNLMFIVKLSNKVTYIKYVSDNIKANNELVGDVINLYSTYDDGKTFLEVLAYELIKRMYPLELVDDDSVYVILRETNIDSYFYEFIYSYLIPMVKRYERNKNLDGFKINNLEELEFLKIYDDYEIYVRENKFVLEDELVKKIEKHINEGQYKYLFLVGDINFKCEIPVFMCGNDYYNNILIKDSVKLLYDYKRYLYENQLLPVMDTYLSKDELSILTKKFLKDNLKIINDTLEKTNKSISVLEYDDSNRLRIYQNISNCCFEELNKLGSNGLIGFNSLKDVNILIGNNGFTKVDKNTLMVDGYRVNVGEVLKIDKMYDVIMLPNLIKDIYHEDIFNDNYQYKLKVMLYVALNKCRRELILLCPSSKRDEVDVILNKVGKEV